MSSLEEDITIDLQHLPCDDCDYKGALTSITATIRLKQASIGKISATLMNRQAIPDKCFYQVADEHSGELQWIVGALLENRWGRTKLESLAEDDDTEFDFLYIGRFHVNGEYKQNGNSDVGAIALHKFLRHPFISGHDAVQGSSGGSTWKVSSAAYAIDPQEAMSPTEKEQYRRTRDAMSLGRTGSNQDAVEQRRLDAIARSDANQFLRNGFMQDRALAKSSPTNARILVASSNMWDQPAVSHAQATAIQFYEPPPVPAKEDSDIRDAVEKAIERECSSAADLSRLTAQIDSLVAAGGSLARSKAIQVACANNFEQIVEMLLMKEPTLVNSRDELELTPLMVAAASAAGRMTNAGLGETRVIRLLLEAGADKNLQDRRGMTAYGHFKQAVDSYNQMMMAMLGRSVSVDCPRQPALLRQLMPAGGPTAGDESGGKGAGTGFVDYTEEDRIADREMGRDGSDGDY